MKPKCFGPGGQADVWTAHTTWQGRQEGVEDCIRSQPQWSLTCRASLGAMGGPGSLRDRRPLLGSERASQPCLLWDPGLYTSLFMTSEPPLPIQIHRPLWSINSPTFSQGTDEDIEAQRGKSVLCKAVVELRWSSTAIPTCPIISA